MAFALQDVLVLGVVLEPAEQGLAGILAHARVGQAHRQGHQGREVVGVELKTPGRRRRRWGEGGKEAGERKGGWGLLDFKGDGMG